MKSLVVFYSRDGATRKLAKSIAVSMGADIEEIVDVKRRSGRLGYIGGCIDSLLGRVSEISQPTSDPSSYDCVIVGTPVWAMRMAPAVRSYLRMHSGKFRRAGLFCTFGGSGGEKAFGEMESFTGPAVVKLGLTRAQVMEGDFAQKVVGFIGGL